jgi:hypothetical protein
MTRAASLSIVGLLAAGPSWAATAPLEVPFEITSNKPFVQVTINGSKPRWFILDTGCSGGSVIARRCADELKLELSDPVRTHLGAGAGVAVGVATTPDVTLSLSSDTMSVPALRVFPLDHVSPYEGRRVEGLLGEDFMRRHVVTIDYARQTLRVFDPALFQVPPGGVIIPIRIEYGLVVARGSITPNGHAPIPCRFIIDTGVRTTLVLFHPFSLAHHLLGPRGSAISGTIGGGAGGETKGDVGRLASLSIGSVTIARPTALCSRDTVGVFAGHDPDGIVGGELLRHYRVTFDYPHQRLILEPVAGGEAAFDYDMSGLFLVGEGDDFSRVTIKSVADHTPAREAGLERGDEIVAIDGRPAGGFKLDEVRGLFRKPGLEYRLDVKRGDTRLQIRLTTRRLV